MKGRRLAAPLLAAAVLAAIYAAAAWIPVARARQAWRSGHWNEAEAIARRGLRLHVWGAQYHRILAVAYLDAGNDRDARPHLTRMAGVGPVAIGKTEVVRRLFARKRYTELLNYDRASPESPEEPDVLLHRAAAEFALNRVAAAAATLQAIDASRVDPRRYAALRSAIKERVDGAVPYVFDRHGGVIAVYKSRGGEVVATDADFAPFVDRQAGLLTVGAIAGRIGTQATVDTTLDPFVQKAALEALGSHRGSLVAIDPRTNEILAVASNAPENLAFERQYEPGSVIKVLTGLDALSGGVDVGSMFPYVCKGRLTIDGRRFADWVPWGHGKLASIDDALAVSCNTFFADLGLRVGRDSLLRFLNSAGFGGQVNLGLFQVPLGRVVGPVGDDYQTALLSIGLEHEVINTLHLAMLASMMANRGTLTTPRLLRGRRSIFGDVIALPPPQGTTRVASPAAAEAMIRAMQAVAVDPHGTGHRALVEGVPLAIKTGTSGEKKDGLDALILAFAPVNSPRIAFGIIAENAGPAEVAGAEIAHDFLERIKGRL